jgi:hypothetical protein
VVNLDMSVFGMNTGVEEIINREEPKRKKNRVKPFKNKARTLRTFGDGGWIGNLAHTRTRQTERVLSI